MLFLLDASNHVEQQQLEEWLDRTRDKQDFSGTAGRVIVPIADSPEDIPTDKLLKSLQASPDALLIPIRVTWLKALDVKGTTPRLRDLLFGTPRHPGAFKARRILKKHPRRAKCISAKPATVHELKSKLEKRLGATPDDNQLAEFVAGQASIALDIAERRLRGSRYKVPRRVAKNLQSSQAFNSAINELSSETGTPISQLLNEANKIFKELISVPRAFWLDVSYLLNRKLSSLGYKSKIVIDEKDLSRMRQITKQHPAAILCTHKTHVDFPALNAAFFENDFPALHTFGGVNMAFSGVGFLARRAGVIFIRRSFQDDPLYKLILRQYIGYLMEKHFPLSWAFEGTRSRVGKLMPPKYGILKYVVEAANANHSRNLHIIPLAINYDLISDVRDYAREQSGAAKRPESLSWFLEYMRSLKRPMGQIYMDFGEPIVLETAPDPDDRLALAKVAMQVGVEVNRVTPITLASLATMLLLGSAPRALTRTELARAMRDVVYWAQARDIKMTDHFEIENEAELDAMAKVLINNKIVKRYDDGPEEIYAISEKRYLEASFYRNTSIHHFVSKALAELALISIPSDSEMPLQQFWNEIDILRDMFKFEFFYKPKQVFQDEVRGELSRFDDDWERQLKDEATYANRLLRKFKPLVAHATLTQIVEAYFIVAEVAAMASPSADMPIDRCVEECFVHGRQAYRRRLISSEASIGKLLFQNGYRWLSSRGLCGPGGPDLADKRLQTRQELSELMRRLQQIQALALPAP